MTAAIALLTFTEAIDALRADKRVARLAWPADVFCEMHSDDLMIHVQGDGDTRPTWHSWTLRREDLEAADWVVL